MENSINNDIPTMHTKSNNIELMMGNELWFIALKTS